MTRPRRSYRRTERPARGAEPRRYSRRPRRSNAPIIILCAALGVGALAAVGFLLGSDRMSREDEQTVVEVMKEVERNMAEVARKIMLDPSAAGSGAANVCAAQARLLRNRAQEVRGDAARLLRTVAFMFEEEARVLGDYEEALKAVEDDGGIDPTGLDQPGAIAKRRRLWAAFQKKNAAVRQFFSGLGGTLDGQMRREGLSAKRRAEVAEGLLKSINRKQATIDRVRDADDELCDLAEEIFKLLEKNAGKWEASEHVVQFDNENAAGIYNELISEIQAVARKQAAAQRELTGAMLR